jgi:hypothetical protein
MCVEMLAKYVKPEDTVLDVGCGSGILGITASKLGAKKVIMTDIDECAVTATEHNMRLNGITNGTVLLKNLLDDNSVKGQVIACNIMAEVLIAFAPYIGGNLTDNGLIILSGILVEKLPSVRKAYLDAGFTFVEEKIKGELILIGPDICKDKLENSEFEEDYCLFKSWKQYAQTKGLRIRLGHWKIIGEPIVILVDFTQYFSQKDGIFSDFWQEYGLDSITGNWDYIEPCLFGYASAKVIENFYEFYAEAKDKIVAQFHEWMTGSGILYLKKYCPQIATAFTTHASVLGRCLAAIIWLYIVLCNILKAKT